MATALFTASQVEARTGIPAATLRQWERRYGVPAPARNTSGYRLYSLHDLAQIEEMQRYLRAGVSTGRAAQLVRAAGPPLDPTPSALATALLAALLASDLLRARALLSEAHARLSVEDVLLTVMSPVLVELGRLWQRGEVHIAQVHQASAFLRSRISALLDVAGLGTFGPHLVAAGAPGEQHEIGLMMVTLVLCRRGARVEYLGPDLPLGDLAAYVRQRQAEGVLLALNGDWALEGVETQKADLLALGVPVFYGGALLNTRPDLAAALGGIYAGPDALAAADTVILRLRRESPFEDTR
ncbi:B12-binding domain-containing protein [Deinococcus sp. YIM 77859]|uniref:MerR family transcriptional regulator n=1 Tax=Deinococcus sp. YIM 77859 TaxID=1540221 RepID=UPI000A848EA9|nr:B12-binding domain-containing protein [Deinococcus sp. YIM 77859]